MNLATEQQNSKAAEIGGVIRLAHAMKAAALSAPTAIAAQAILENLKALSLEAGNIDPSGQIAKMIYNFTQDAYKRVEQLATEEAAAQSSREGIMGDPVRIDPKKEPLAAKLTEFGMMSEAFKKKFESIDPKADIRVAAFKQDAKGDFHPAGDNILKGQRIRDSAAIMSASGELAAMGIKLQDGEMKPGSPEYKKYIELQKIYNKQIYGQEERPNQYKPGLSAEEKREAQDLLRKGHERLRQAIIDIHGHIAAEKSPLEREAAAEKLKGKLSSTDRVESATERLAQAEAKNSAVASIATPNHSGFASTLTPEIQAVVEAERQRADLAIANSELRSARSTFVASTTNSRGEWAEEDASPTRSQEQETRIQLAENQDNSPAAGSPLPAGAPALASAAHRR